MKKNRNNLFSSFHSKHVSASDKPRPARPITYSTPSPVYLTTPTPQHDTKDYPDAPPSYDYEDIVVQHTSPAPEFHTVKVTTFAPDERYLQTIRLHHPTPIPDLHSAALPEILTKLQKSNHLPETLSVDNVDNSIKTLAKILNNMKQHEVVQKPPTKYHNQADDDYDYANYGSDDDGI